MAIQVTCPGCLKRFSVGDQHAGKQGPCPSCKQVIQIPKLEEQVVIHEAPPEGPVDSKGRSLFKTDRRTDAKFSPLVAGAAVAVVLLSVFAALLLKSKVAANETSSYLILGAIAAVLGPIIVRGGYMFVRDDELEPYRGSSLWIRVIACGLVFAVAWFLYGFLLSRLTSPDDIAKGLQMWEFWPVVIMFMVGMGAGMVALDLQPANAVMLFMFFFLATATLRLIAGLQFVPGLGAVGG